jgi:hypothetical protein
MEPVGCSPAGHPDSRATNTASNRFRAPPHEDCLPGRGAGMPEEADFRARLRSHASFLRWAPQPAPQRARRSRGNPLSSTAPSPAQRGTGRGHSTSGEPGHRPPERGAAPRRRAGWPRRQCPPRRAAPRERKGAPPGGADAAEYGLCCRTRQHRPARRRAGRRRSRSWWVPGGRPDRVPGPALRGDALAAPLQARRDGKPAEAGGGTASAWSPGRPWTAPSAPAWPTVTGAAAGRAADPAARQASAGAPAPLPPRAVPTASPGSPGEIEALVPGVSGEGTNAVPGL